MDRRGFRAKKIESESLRVRQNAAHGSKTVLRAWRNRAILVAVTTSLLLFPEGAA